MQIRFRKAWHLVLGVCLSSAAPAALAQVEPPVPIDEVDTTPRPKPIPPSAKPKSLPAPDAGISRLTRDGPGKQPPAPKAPPPEPPPPPPFKGVGVSRATDEDLASAWSRWRRGIAEPNPKLAESAQKELLTFKDDLGIADLDAYSVGFIRASEARSRTNDPMGAVSLATAAIQLAPDLPHAHLALARAYFFADASDIGRYFGEVVLGLRCLWQDPRYWRPVLADVGVSVLFALLATTVAVTATLFLRRARYALHDFHHLFPRGAARWQSACFVVLLLSLPLVLRLGVLPAVLAFFAAVAAYLSATEAAVAGVLISLLAIAPLEARWLVSETSFAETPAEDVYHLERGGLQAKAAAEQVQKRVAERKAQFEELFALGRYELRRGQLDLALDHLQQAAGRKNNDPGLLTNVGNAMFAKGDVEGAAESYVAAGSLDPSFAPSFYNLAVLYTRKAASLPPDAAVAEVQKAQSALDTVQRLQPSLVGKSDLAQETLANRALIAPALPLRDLLPLATPGETDLRVQSQLSAQLLGNLDSSVAWVFPLAAVTVLGAVGVLLRSAGASKACMRCGRPVCRRCDPELSRGSVLCQQCVNVFARKNVVGPPVKIRKQIEVAQFRLRMERLSYLFGLLCSGAGHVFSGLPVRGAIHAFIFLFTLSTIVFRQGVVRYPYGTEPLFMRLTPLGIALIAVYLLSLRGLYKQQS